MPEASFNPDEVTIQNRASAVHVIFIILKNHPVSFVDRVTDLVINQRSLSVTDACDILSRSSGLSREETEMMISKVSGVPFDLKAES
jgi:hypothetical protein